MQILMKNPSMRPHQPGIDSESIHDCHSVCMLKEKASYSSSSKYILPDADKLQWRESNERMRISVDESKAVLEFRLWHPLVKMLAW